MDYHLTRDQLELFNCEISDEYLKRRFIDIKEIYYKIFKSFTKFIKLIKAKDEMSIKKAFDELTVNQKEFLNLLSLLRKIVEFKQQKNKEVSFYIKLVQI
jgi:hypothetical protein